jgi:hypothetical protein
MLIYRIIVVYFDFILSIACLELYAFLLIHIGRYIYANYAKIDVRERIRKIIQIVHYFREFPSFFHRDVREENYLIEFMFVEPYANEEWHIVADSFGKLHIGLSIEVFNGSDEIVNCVDLLMTSSTFFYFPIQTAKKYLVDSVEEDNPILIASDIAYVTRVPGLYDLPDMPVIMKTFWIRIIQRRWKRVYSEKMRLLRLRGSLKAQRQFELTGKYGIRSDILDIKGKTNVLE